MTKEELKQEAEELIQRFEMANSMNCFMQLTPDRKQIGEMLVMIAEPREKRIAELEARCNELFFQVNEKIAKISELEAQIEKMKCCGNCAKNGHICVAEEMQGKLCGKNKDKWELRR